MGRDDDLEYLRDLGVKLDGGLVRPEGADRRIDLDLPLVDVDPGFTFQLLGDVRGGDGAEETAGLAGLRVDGDGQLAQPLGRLSSVDERFLDAPPGRSALKVTW